MEYDWNNARRHYIYYEAGDYSIAQELYPLLHKPFLTLKKVEGIIDDITYRKIGLWCNDELVSDSREDNDAGWRKFSYIDIIKLLLITDLRKFNMPIDDIKVVINKVSHTTFTQLVKPTTIRVLELEYFYLKAQSGNRIALLIDFKKEPIVVFGTEAKTMVDYQAIQQADSPLLILPFFSYVQKIASLSNQTISVNEKTSMSDVVLKRFYAPSSQEQKIVDLIRNKGYEEIVIKRSNDEILLKAKHRESGKFTDKDVIDFINKRDYQSVTVITDKGQKGALIQEASIKV